jgi:hypothetical protein
MTSLPASNKGVDCWHLLQALHKAAEAEKTTQIAVLQVKIADMAARADSFERQKATVDEKMRELEVRRLTSDEKNMAGSICNVRHAGCQVLLPRV